MTGSEPCESSTSPVQVDLTLDRRGSISSLLDDRQVAPDAASIPLTSVPITQWNTTIALHMSRMDMWSSFAEVRINEIIGRCSNSFFAKAHFAPTSHT